MAIDPSIALDVKAPENPLAMVSQYASAQNSLAQAANAKAALPGIQADSAIKQRAASFNSWMTANASKYINPTVGDDGKPTAGAYHAVDTTALVAAASKAGYVTEAQGIAANDLSNQSKFLQNGLTQASTKNTEAATNGTNINNATNANNLAVSTRGYVSTLMDAYVKANPNAPSTMYDKEYNKLLNGVQDQYGSALNIKGVFGNPDNPAVMINGQQQPASYKFDPVENKAMLTATMSPQVQQELANSKEVIAMSGATGQSSPQYRDPNSAETANARQIAIAVDPTHADQYKNMTGAQLAVNTVVGGAVMAGINPQGARTAAVVEMGGHVNNAKQYGNAADALEALKQKFGQDPTMTQMGPFAWIQNNVAKFGNDPTFQTAQSALGNVNQVHPELKLTTLDAGSLSIALRNQQSNSLNLAGTAGAIATAPTTAAAAQGVAGQGGRPNASPTNPRGATSSAAGTVRMQDKNGKTYLIPRAQATKAKADGLTEVQ